MDHHEIYGSSPPRALPSSAAHPDSPPSQTAPFRSQKISASVNSAFSSPPLLQPNSTRLPAKVAPNSPQQDPLVFADKKEQIGTIPVFPSFHIAERTAIQIPEETMSASAILDRILDYLRLHSISFECEQDTGCLDCMSPSMVGFVVQLWRGQTDATNTENLHWVEVQRRQGCAIAMNAIRRTLIRHVKGADNTEAKPSSLIAIAGHRRPCSEFTPDSSDTRSNKRQRSLSPHSSRLNCQEAIGISLRLLESGQKDQQRLGLESLSVLTDSRLVRPDDAIAVSRVLILGEGSLGSRFQQQLEAILREFKPTRDPSELAQDSFHSALSSMLYHIALHVLVNAMEQVPPQNTSSSSLWQTVMVCLINSLENAEQRPHEAALAAKCLRYLLPVQSAPTNTTVMQTALQRSRAFGRVYNVALEEESKKTLCFL